MRILAPQIMRRRLVFLIIVIPCPEHKRQIARNWWPSSYILGACRSRGNTKRNHVRLI